MDAQPRYIAFHVGHDGNICKLEQDGVLHLELERLTRKKHYFFNIKEYPVSKCLTLLAVESPADLERHAMVCHSIHSEGFHLDELTYSFHDPHPVAGHKVFPGLELFLLDHHFTHACVAWLTRPSDFSETDILAYDGWGLYTDRVFFDRSLNLTDSSVLGLGRLWADVSEVIFHANRQEGKVMGLAAHGNRSDAMEDDLLEHLAIMGEFNLSGDPAERIRIKPSVFARATSLLKDRHLHRTGESWKRDLSRTLQDLSRRIVLEYLAARRTCDFLCMAGGIALNGYINQALMEEGIYRRVHVPPACGDDGLALGACLWMAWRDGDGRMSDPASIMYGGRDHPVDETLVARLLQGTKMRFRRADGSRLLKETAGLIASGKIVGWYQGRSETGPRALGNRSILADPRDPGMKDRLNARVKHRESFRPFAPSVLAERVDEWFEGARDGRYMLTICRFREEVRHLVPSVVHVDGTGRIQTVHQEDNERFHGLLCAFEDLTGVPMLLNTSFNDRGEPIVDSPQDAFRTFAATEMDVLVLKDWIIEKPDSP